MASTYQDQSGQRLGDVGDRQQGLVQELGGKFQGGIAHDIGGIA